MEPNPRQKLEMCLLFISLLIPHRRLEFQLYRGNRPNW